VRIYVILAIQYLHNNIFLNKTLIMNLFEGIDDKYKIGKVRYKDIAFAMDFINEYTMRSYCGDIEEKALPHEIQNHLYKKFFL